jgi:hypothetical protein
MMTTIVIKPKSRAEVEFLTHLFKKMNVNAQLVEEDVPNYETRKAIADVEQRKGRKAKDSAGLFNELGI